MNERIARIKNFAQERDNRIAQEQLEKQQGLIRMLEQVKELAPRMRELMDVATALYENRIPLGKMVGYNDPSTEFISNWWSHKVGFIADIVSSGIARPRGFGIIGGGACGHDLTFSVGGVPACVYSHNNDTPGVAGRTWDDSDIHHLRSFIHGFDDFERRFYEYVDGLK